MELETCLCNQINLKLRPMMMIMPQLEAIMDSELSILSSFNFAVPRLSHKVNGNK